MEASALCAFQACCQERNVAEKLASFEAALYPDPEERVLVVQPELHVTAIRMAAKRAQLVSLKRANATLEGEVEQARQTFAAQQQELMAHREHMERMIDALAPAHLLDKASALAVEASHAAQSA
jgi:hypothetical protein